MFCETVLLCMVTVMTLTRLCSGKRGKGVRDAVIYSKLTSNLVCNSVIFYVTVDRQSTSLPMMVSKLGTVTL